MKTCLMLVEGVLRNLVGGALIPEGARLYKSLCATGTVVLLSVVYDGDKRREMQEWLDMNGLTEHALLTWGDDGPRVPLANMYRREGYDVDLVVDPDPVTVSGLIEAGFNTLLFTHSQYSHPSWRPDAAKGVEPWASITQQVAQLARLKAQDNRLTGD